MGQLMRAIQEDARAGDLRPHDLGTMALVEAAYRSAERGQGGRV